MSFLIFDFCFLSYFQRKKRTHIRESEDAFLKIPKTFIFRRGKVGLTVKELIQDMRKVMSPFTAINLKV
jgi:ribosome biogenesis protein SSF1/2